SRSANEVQNSDYHAVRRVFISADIDGDVGVDAKFVGQVALQINQIHLFLFNVHVAQLIDSDIDDIGFEIALGDCRGGQVHLDRLHADHTQAREHKGGEQEEHDVDQRDNFDPRLVMRDRRSNLQNKSGS